MQNSGCHESLETRFSLFITNLSTCISRSLYRIGRPAARARSCGRVDVSTHVRKGTEGEATLTMHVFISCATRKASQFSEIGRPSSTVAISLTDRP